MTPKNAAAQYFAGPQLIYGWHPKTLESHGAGNGVVGYSADFPAEIGRSAADLGRLTRLWGGHRAEPSGIRDIRSRLRSLEFSVQGGWRLWVRKYPETGAQSGACFVHIVAVADPGFGAPEALFAEFDDGAFTTIARSPYSLPSPVLPHAKLVVDTAAVTRHRRSPSPRSVTTVASALDVLSRPGASLGLVANEPEVIAQAVADIVTALPSGLVGARSMSTFAFPDDAENIDIVGMLKRFESRKRSGAFASIVDLDRAIEPSRNDPMVDVVVRLTELARREVYPPATIDSVAGLTGWIAAAESVVTRRDELGANEVVAILRYDDLRRRWLDLPGSAELLLDHAATDGDVASHLGSVRDQVPVGRVVEVLAVRALTLDWADAYRRAEELNVPSSAVDDAVADRFVDLALSGGLRDRPDPARMWGAVSPRLSAEQRRRIAGSPAGTEIIAATHDPELASEFLGIAVSMRDAGRIDWLLGILSPAVSAAAVVRWCSAPAALEQIDDLFATIDMGRALSIVVHSVLTADPGDEAERREHHRATMVVRKVLSEREIPVDWQNHALRSYWPDILSILPVGDRWRSAFGTTLVPVGGGDGARSTRERDRHSRREPDTPRRAVPTPVTGGDEAGHQPDDEAGQRSGFSRFIQRLLGRSDRNGVR